ncbi:B12-binding domain-containing radical SAM protein [Desulfobacter vibrioformis]|uniref:B12-binding domain-containing radical SAM protein n=1 Tax=Desulfobacter vibrioformis TaxID=34031 RepID=UPI00054FAB81|nr:B12-binding domain-containing radical SAM protein [Desulfobacter vibrioformis]
MVYEIDCLLLGYSGLHKASCKEYQILANNHPEIKKVQTSLNSAITYLGTALDKKGLTFDFVNSIENDLELIIEKVKSQKYFTIGISTTICQSIPHLKNFVKLLKRINKDIKIIIGGALIVSTIRDLLKDGQDVFNETLRDLYADYIVDSIYGEDRLASLVYNLKNNIPEASIPNLYIREKDQFRCDLKVADDYKLEENKVNWKLFKGRTGGTVVIRTSLSCCFRCSFCSFPVMAGKFQAGDLEHIERELNEIESLGEVNLVHFIDDTLNVPISRFKKMLRMFIKNRYTFKWHCFLRCQNLDEEAVQLMSKSGCIGVLLGLESGSDHVLKVMNKGTKIKNLTRGILLLKKYNITIIASFFVGFPGETVRSVNDTYRFIKEIDVDFYYIGLWFYDPYTPIAKRKNEFDLKGIFFDWSHSSMDSEIANKLLIQIKTLIKSSTLLESINNAFLFQMLNSYIDVPALRYCLDSDRNIEVSIPRERIQEFGPKIR